MNTTKIQIQLDKVNDIKRLIELVSKMPNVVDATQGRHSIDAKSLMGLVSLNLDAPITLCIYGNVDKSFLYLLENFNAYGGN